MRRRAFTLAAGLSLLICLACIGAIAIGSAGPIERVIVRGPRLWDGGLAHGHVWISFVDGWPADAPDHHRIMISTDAGLRQWWVPGHLCWGDSGLAGVYQGLEDETRIRRGRYHNFGLELWPLAVLAGILPLAWARRKVQAMLRARRRKAGICAICRYDLRASREVCPECGMPNPMRAEENDCSV